MRGIRGATTVTANTREAIAEATQELLRAIADRNHLTPDGVVSMLFTLTPDLNADFPARAARAAGWDVPMLDMVELEVPGALPCCLRVLIHVDRDAPPRHVYLREAATLRPDVAGET